MKIKVLFFFALLILSLFQSVATASGIKTYRNDKIGFEISYLDNWQESIAPEKPTLFIKRKSTTEPGTISIDVANFTGDKDKFIREMKSNSEKFIEKYKQRFPRVEMLANGDTYLGGFPAYFITINYTLKNLNTEIDIVAMQIFCIKNKNIYIVNFETPLLLFGEMFNEFQAIMATFNFRR